MMEMCYYSVRPTNINFLLLFRFCLSWLLAVRLNSRKTHEEHRYLARLLSEMHQQAKNVLAPMAIWLKTSYSVVCLHFSWLVVASEEVICAQFL